MDDQKHRDTFGVFAFLRTIGLGLLGLGAVALFIAVAVTLVLGAGMLIVAAIAQANVGNFWPAGIIITIIVLALAYAIGVDIQKKTE